MSEQMLLRWMQSIDKRLTELQSSVADCQGRCRADLAVRRADGRGKRLLVKSLAALAAAAAGALTAHFAGQ